MEIPQTGRQPLPVSDDDIRLALRRPHPQDNVDFFATDPNPEIRRLGQLALRREDINDQFALGDLCAKRSLTDDKRLLVFYVAKTLIAYRRALQDADNDVDRTLAHRAVDEFIAWVLATAHKYPTRRNIAVALWAVAEAESSSLLALVDRPASWLNTALVEKLLNQYRENQPRQPDQEAARTTPEQPTIVAPDISEFGLSQSLATIGENTIDTAALTFEAERSLIDVLDETRFERAASVPYSVDAIPEIEPVRTALASTLQTVVEDSGNEFRIGERIEGRYEIADLRRGGMGIVYLCYDHENREPVAIKSFQGRFFDNERAVARFFQEAATWIHLEKHRHIVQARLVQNIAGRPHIILEHISGPEGLGPDLKSWIDHKRLDLVNAIEFGLHI